MIYAIYIQSAWTVPPFAAHEQEGRVYGRGAQDMKCVCVQYLIALQRLRVQLQQEGEREGEGGVKQLVRTVRLAWVPDEVRREQMQ